MLLHDNSALKSDVLLLKTKLLEKTFDIVFRQEDKLVERDSGTWQIQGDPTILVTLAHIFNHFAPLMVNHSRVSVKPLFCKPLYLWLMCVFASVKCT